MKKTLLLTVGLSLLLLIAPAASASEAHQAMKSLNRALVNHYLLRDFEQARVGYDTFFAGWQEFAGDEKLIGNAAENYYALLEDMDRIGSFTQVLSGFGVPEEYYSHLVNDQDQKQVTVEPSEDEDLAEHNRFVTMDMKNIAAGDALRLVARSTGTRIGYPEEINRRRINLTVRDARAEDVVKQVATMIQATVHEEDGGYTITVNSAEQGGSNDSNEPDEFSDGKEGQDQEPGANQYVSLSFSNIAASEAVRIVARSTGLNIVCPESLSTKKISIQAKNLPVNQVLDMISKQTGTRITKTGKGIVMEETEAGNIRKMRTYTLKGSSSDVGELLKAAAPDVCKLLSVQKNEGKNSVSFSVLADDKADTAIAEAVAARSSMAIKASFRISTLEKDDKRTIAAPKIMLLEGREGKIEIKSEDKNTDSYNYLMIKFTANCEPSGGVDYFVCRMETNLEIKDKNTSVESKSANSFRTRRDFSTSFLTEEGKEYFIEVTVEPENNSHQQQAQ
ncbi:MAG: hypothetical protein PHQ23_11875 [Candidatus Wallbacteria bacterium]|nr:hypothetical protein [Candidatus Wallbacteria bacterium]